MLITIIAIWWVVTAIIGSFYIQDITVKDKDDSDPIAVLIAFLIIFPVVPIIIAILCASDIQNDA